MIAARRADVDSGLPGRLPEGEVVLWQGAPSTAALVRSALHIRLVAIYFAIAAAIELAVAWSRAWTPAETLAALGVLAASAAAVIGLVWIFAALVGRSTVYTITTRRIVMRIGIALPVTFNVPFAIVEAAGLRLEPDGSGDIPLALGGSGRVGFIHLWPHVRPWRIGRPEPMLRCVPDARQVAAILSRALGAGQIGKAAMARAASSAGVARAVAPAAA